MKRFISIIVIVFFTSFFWGTDAKADKVIKAQKVTDESSIKAEKKEVSEHSDKELSTLKGGLFITGNYNLTTGANFGTGYYFHKNIGLELDFGFSLNNRRDEYESLGITKLNSYQFFPSLKVNIPVYYSRWSVLILSPFSGVLIDKVEQGDMGIGNRSGLNMEGDIFLLKERSIALKVLSGIEYYSFKSAKKGSGFETNFGIGFNYYF